MDPITIVGLASSILTFIQFGTKVIQCAHQAKLKEDTEAIDVTVSELQRLCMTLDTDRLPKNENEKALYRLAEGCKTVSEEIIELLGKIKPKDCSSKIQNMSSAIKLKLYERQLSEKETRLNAYQKQLELQLNYMSRSEINNKLDSLVYIDGENGTQLNTLQSHVLQLRQGVQVSSLGEKAQEQLQQLLGLSENAAKRMAQQRILKALAFSTMRRRFDAVEEAHEQTFRWMFEEKSPSGTGDDSHSHDSQEYKQGVAGRLFTDWLSRGQGIFHITGKIGSGKSTLVKFLCNHPRTRQELDTWAGARKLVIANFFFWKPGNELQKSLKGLLQSILHDLLKQCPDLIAVVFPKHWDQVYNGSSNNRSELEFRPDEIREAFMQSIRNGSLYHRYCFCFFIDGLDEYQETHQDDYKTMVELLWKWTKIAPEYVKFCVSSREYNVFLNGFSPDKRIKVQDLTKSDIEKYAEDKLKDVDFWTKQRLVSCIVDRASGIFLWVALVVKSLRERLEDGCGAEELKLEIASLPDELEGLFGYLFNSIHPSIRQKAYQTFRMVLRCDDMYVGAMELCPSTYSFLEEYNSDPDFLLKADLSCAPMSSEALSTRMEGARKRLYGYCKGLVEARELKDPYFHSEYDRTIVVFTHRSVVEFLERPDIKSTLNLHLEGFDCDLTLLKLFIANIRLCQDQPHAKQLNGIAFVCGVFLHRKSEENSDPAPYGFREGLWQIMNVVCPERWFAPFLGYDVIRRDGYEAWKFRQSPEILQDRYKLGQLVCLGSKMSQALLQQGLGPQAIVYPPNTLCDPQPLTFWELYLLSTMNDHYGDNFRVVLLLSSTVELFLNSGACPDFSITLSPDSIKGEEPLRCKSVEFAFENNPKRDIKLRTGLLSSVVRFAATRSYRLCLKDLIEYSDLKNEDKEKLLVLAARCSASKVSMHRDPVNPVEPNHVFLLLLGFTAVVLIFALWPTISSATRTAAL